MVCIPCIVIPFVLWVYHKFLQPWIYPVISKFWTSKQLTSSSNGEVKKCPFNSTENKAEVTAGGEMAKDKKTD
ncbi:unnamed protein product [Clavelina lepadiformis]|uniref:CR032 protein n=1 Tax=Clavelina lepadiformis TaxID=159417 RepID=A0ABP0GKA5_CLALP